MSSNDLKALVENAERAITSRDFDRLMMFYADDAALVVRPGLVVSGKEKILRAWQSMSVLFDNGLNVRRGEMEVLEGGGTALVLMETALEFVSPEGYEVSTTHRATYTFRKDKNRWLCAIDNSYGTALLDG